MISEHTNTSDQLNWYLLWCFILFSSMDVLILVIEHWVLFRVLRLGLVILVIKQFARFGFQGASTCHPVDGSARETPVLRHSAPSEIASTRLSGAPADARVRLRLRLLAARATTAPESSAASGRQRLRRPRRSPAHREPHRWLRLVYKRATLRVFDNDRAVVWIYPFHYPLQPLSSTDEFHRSKHMWVEWTCSCRDRYRGKEREYPSPEEAFALPRNAEHRRGPAVATRSGDPALDFDSADPLLQWIRWRHQVLLPTAQLDNENPLSACWIKNLDYFI